MCDNAAAGDASNATAEDGAAQACDVLSVIGPEWAAGFMAYDYVLVTGSLLLSVVSVLALVQEVFRPLRAHGRKARIVTFFAALMHSSSRSVVILCSGGELFTECNPDVVRSVWLFGYFALFTMHLFCIFSFEQILLVIVNPFTSSGRSITPLARAVILSSLAVAVGMFALVELHLGGGSIFNRLFEISFVFTGCVIVWRIFTLRKTCSLVLHYAADSSRTAETLNVIPPMLKYMRGAITVTILYMVIILIWIAHASVVVDRFSPMHFRFRFIAGFAIPVLLEEISQLILLGVVRPARAMHLSLHLNGKVLRNLASAWWHSSRSVDARGPGR